MAAVIDNKAIQAIFAQPRSDGSFEGPVLQYLRSIGERRPLLLLAFAPKAAGTYFRQAAIFATNGQLIRISHAQGGRDGRLYLPTVLTCCLDDESAANVTHIHMQALAANKHFIQTFGLKPIIMIRNIPDMLASFVDMLESDPTGRAEGLNCQVPDNFLDFDRAQKLDFVMDVIAPWYVSYFATWKTFVDEAPEAICVLRYRKFLSHPADTLHGALTHAGFAVAHSKCEEAMARAWKQRQMYRFNKGERGRGKTYFSPAHLAALSRMLSYYPQLASWQQELIGQGGENFSDPGNEYDAPNAPNVALRRIAAR